MFSINIDKIVAMSPAQEAAYSDLCNQILAKGRKYKAIAVTGEVGYAFRLAESIRAAGNKVLYIDGDISTPVFMRKYKLGKDLKGLSNFLDGEQDSDSILCVTNKSDLNVIFSGSSCDGIIAGQGSSYEAAEEMAVLLDDYRDEYHYIIVEVAEDTMLASKCDGTILVMDHAEYSAKVVKEKVADLDRQGCTVLGVTLVNV